jgi:hypothetical protein
MDDGLKIKEDFHLNTHSFTINEVELLSKILLKKFDIKSTIQSHKNSYRIYIIVESMNLFRNIVKPYFYESMLYKLNL